MKKEKNKNQSFMDGFLDNFSMTRRSFMKKATAATGTTVALGGLRPSFRALAASGNIAAGEMGEWKASTCQGCTSWCSERVQPTAGDDSYNALVAAHSAAIGELARTLTAKLRELGKPPGN